MHRLLLIVACATTVLTASGLGQTSFAGPMNIWFGSMSRYSIADVDGDLIDDLLVTQGLQIQISYRGVPGEGFAHILSAPVSQMQTYVADLDGDGDKDVIGYGGGTFSVFKQDPTGFVRTDLTLPPVASVADINGDDAADVIHSDGFVSINDGTGNFAAPVNLFGLLPNVLIGAHALSDLDGDGDLDVAILFTTITATGGSMSIWTLNNDGTGLFSQGWISPTFPVAAQEIHAADLDGDGDKELLTTNTSVFMSISIFENTGGNTFVDHGQTSTGPATGFNFPSITRIADFDGDGRDDVAYHYFNTLGFPPQSLINVYTGEPGPALMLSSSPSVQPPAAGILDVGHLDLDGAPDLVFDHSPTIVPTVLTGLEMRQNTTLQQNEIHELEFTQGDGQATLAGTPYPTPVVAKLTDTNGIPVAGATVRFGVRYPATLSATTAVTDANGLVSVNVVSGADQRHEPLTIWTDTAAPIGTVLEARGPTTVSAVAGTPQTVSFGQFARPLVASVTDTATGAPLAGQTVFFDVNGTLAATETTDAAGLATFNYLATAGTGPLTVEATTLFSDPFSADFDLWVRRLDVFWDAPNTSLIINFDNAPDLPFVLAVDSPQPSIPTLHGPVLTSILAPGPDLIVLDGLGAGIGFPDPTLIAAPSFTRTYVLPPGAVSGLTRVFQTYGYDPTAPWPHTFFTSNGSQVIFP